MYLRTYIKSHDNLKKKIEGQLSGRLIDLRLKKECKMLMKDRLTVFHEGNRLSCHRLEIVNYVILLKRRKQKPK